MKECCGNCYWHAHEDISDGYVCVNDKSPHTADWTNNEDWCNEWEKDEE